VADHQDRPINERKGIMQNITFAELDTQAVELLPSKETLFFDTNWVGIYASNSSLAVNAATLLSQANSAAVQTVYVSQH
jgi:hypothetical protein